MMTVRVRATTSTITLKMLIMMTIIIANDKNKELSQAQSVFLTILYQLQMKTVFKIENCIFFVMEHSNANKPLNV